MFAKNSTMLEAEKAKHKFGVVPLLLIYTVIFLISQFVCYPLRGKLGDYANYLPALFELLMVFAFCHFSEGRTLQSIGFQKAGWLKSYLLGFVLGFAIISVAVLTAVLTGAASLSMSKNTSVPALLLCLLIFVIQGMSEEVAVRGGLMVSLTNRMPVLGAVLLSAVMFALRHALNPGLTFIAVLNIGLYGLFAALWLLRKDSLWGIGALHSAWNFTQGHIYGSEVSGVGTSASILRMDSLQSKALLNGGVFGPEGGLIVTVIMVIGIILLLFSLRKKAGEKI
ncbi:MAG: CPBP family intramembrane metalloprotease [Lachnospiraceae bacterium]|jgi:membrane protease YdiL (CAAX protease family)|nr:CPBP family intramembrane metalloprotease [Lachnospiraceae bacterium]